MNIPAVVKSLINAHATLVMAGRKTIEDVPETYRIGSVDYPLRELVDVEVAERTIAKLS